MCVTLPHTPVEGNSDKVHTHTGFQQSSQALNLQVPAYKLVGTAVGTGNDTYM